MHRSYSKYLLVAIVMAAGCAQETPPRTVDEFVADKLLLEAALLRCIQNRNESKYEVECVNAREAVKLIEAKEEAARRAELEALSQRKREALRRTQQAAAEARRRAAAAAKAREELEYQSQFGVAPPDSGLPEDAMQGNEPTAVVPPAAQPDADAYRAPAPAPADTGGSNAPVAVTPPPQEPEPADLDAIREELKRRNEGTGD